MELVSETLLDSSVTSVAMDIACACRPSVTPPSAVALTAELSERAVDRPINVFADSSESLDNSSNLSAIFVKPSFCASIVLTTSAFPLVSAAAIFVKSSFCASIVLTTAAFPLVSAASMSSDLFFNLSFSRNTIIVSNAVIAGLATANATSRPFMSIYASLPIIRGQRSVLSSVYCVQVFRWPLAFVPLPSPSSLASVAL